MDYSKLYPPYHAPPTYQNPPWFVDYDERYAPIPGWGTNLELAAPYGRIGVSGYGAFGLDVPYVDPQGKPQVATFDPSQPTGCSPTGNLHASQQMLKDLGYFSGPVDGVPSPALANAITAFAVASKLSLSASSDVDVCTALMTAWQAKVAANQAESTQKTILVVAAIAAAGTLGYLLWRGKR